MRFLFGDAAWWTTFLVSAFTAQVGAMIWFLTRCKNIRRLDAWLHELSRLDSRSKEILDYAFQAVRRPAAAGQFATALRRYTQASRNLETRLRQRIVATYSFLLAPIASGFAIIAMQFKPMPALAEWLVGASVLLLTTECWFGVQILLLEIQHGPAKDTVEGENLPMDETMPSVLPVPALSSFPPMEPPSASRSTAPPASHDRASPVHLQLEGGARFAVELDHAWEDGTGCCLLSPQLIQGRGALEVGGTVFNVAVTECNRFGRKFTVQVGLCDTSEATRLRGTLLLVTQSPGRHVGS